MGDYLSIDDTDCLKFINASLSLRKVVVTDSLYSLWDTVRENGKVFVVGGKGVGKSFSLLFLVCCYLTKFFVYITHQRIASSLDVDQQDFDFSKLAKESKTHKGDLLILIDITQTDLKYLNLVQDILIYCNSSKIVVATTSGSGYYKNTRIWNGIINYCTPAYSKCALLNFSEEEVKCFKKGTKIESEPLQKIKKVTNFNPYLLHFLSVFGAKEDSEFHAFSSAYLTEYINDVIEDVKESNGLPKFCEKQFQSFYEWGCRAATGNASAITTLPEFTESWGAKEQILYYKRDGDNFYAMSSLPRLDLLLTEITNTIILELPDVAIVHGFLYEQKFIMKMRRCEPITVEGLTEVRLIRIRGVRYTEIITDLTEGFLYHLKFTYPVIDAVGYLSVNETLSLVFVQVSLSPYGKHQTKLEDLFTMPAPEDQTKTIFEYCKDLIGKGQRRRRISALYVYVTPPVIAQPSKKKEEK